jgi:hypothetical protein
LRQPVHSRDYNPHVTNIAATQPCESCGGSLVPRQLAPWVSTAPAADYVCVACEQGYCWSEDPPRLVKMGTADPADAGPHTPAKNS